uniref:Uncharacterized protein n=1 Tax=Panagrolaimus superbus TaxID=310955 RepID=A0A914Y7Q4_9BILA
MKRRATEQIVKENVDDTVREARRKAGYIAMIKDVEDINRFKCPYCKPEKEKDPDSDDHIFDFSVDKDNDEDLKPLRTCVQCRQEYHI